MSDLGDALRKLATVIDDHPAIVRGWVYLHMRGEAPDPHTLNGWRDALKAGKVRHSKAYDGKEYAMADATIGPLGATLFDN